MYDIRDAYNLFHIFLQTKKSTKQRDCIPTNDFERLVEELGKKRDGA